MCAGEFYLCSIESKHEASVLCQMFNCVVQSAKINTTLTMQSSVVCDGNKGRCPDGSDQLCDDPCVSKNFFGRYLLKVHLLLFLWLWWCFFCEVTILKPETVFLSPE